MEPTLKRTNHGAITVIKPIGDSIDIGTSPAMSGELAKSLDKGQINLVVDLTDIAFMDSTGIGVLVSSLKRAKESGGNILLVTTCKTILKIFRVTGLDEAFTICEGLDEALESFKTQVVA